MATPPPSSLDPPTYEEVLNCQFSSWYDTFRNLPLGRKNVTIKSIVLPLPPDFIEFLLSDGIRLPLGATKVSSFAPNEQGGDEDVWSVSTCSEKADGHDQEDAAYEPRQYSFPELNRQIEEAIAELGGSVIPKLNWSCPKDATWVNNGTLKCQTPGDVYLLLKSSDFVMHDVLHAIDMEHTATQYELVLRKWCNLHPSMEFRGFVCNRQLVAISQRLHTQHFPHSSRDQAAIQSRIVDFFDTVMADDRFFPSSNYVFDVYVDKKNRVWLLDFNVWGTQTDSLLYTWEELARIAIAEESPALPQMRIVETELEIQHDPLASYRAPIDTIALASITGSEKNKFDDFMAMCERPSSIGDE